MSDRRRLLMLTRYDRRGASSRYRSYQYIPYLREVGFDITIQSLFDANYLESRYSDDRPRILGAMGAAAAYGSRALHLGTRRRAYDLVWLEKEAFPYVPAPLETLLVGNSAPVVVDLDDAVYHYYDRHMNPAIRRMLGSKIDRIMHRSSLVTAGNEYIATRARQAGAVDVDIVPTVLDLSKYERGQGTPAGQEVRVGWIGTPITAKYLEPIKRAFASGRLGSKVVFCAIGSGGIDWPTPNISEVEWNESTEVSELKKFDIGIMPLPDSPFERGKSGLKLLQYMALGIPVVASPVGVNARLVTDGVEGFLAVTEDEWIEAINLLASDASLRARMGAAGREKVEMEFSLDRYGPYLAKRVASIIE